MRNQLNVNGRVRLTRSQPQPTHVAWQRATAIDLGKIVRIRERESMDNKALNSLRTLSALTVVLGHLRLLFFVDYKQLANPGLATTLVYAAASLGAAAVMFFFVLSGYWVGGSVIRAQQQQSFRWTTYGINRLTRLWLVLIPALLLTGLADNVGRRIFSDADVYIRPEEYVGLSVGHPSYGLRTLLGNIFFLQDIHVPTYGLNHALWSLSCEFWYYLIFPIAFSVIRPGGRKRFRLGFGSMLIVCLAISGPHVIALGIAWLLGAAVGSQRARLNAWSRRTHKGLLAALRLFAALSATVVISAVRDDELPAVLSASIIGLVAASLIALLTDDLAWRGPGAYLLSAGNRIAHTSYSLYATHMPLLVLAAAAIGPPLVLRWHLTLATGAKTAAIMTILGFFVWCFSSLTEKRTDVVRMTLQSWMLGRRRRSTQRMSVALDAEALEEDMLSRALHRTYATNDGDPS